MGKFLSKNRKQKKIVNLNTDPIKRGKEKSNTDSNNKRNTENRKQKKEKEFERRKKEREKITQSDDKQQNIKHDLKRDNYTEQPRTIFYNNNQFTMWSRLATLNKLDYNLTVNQSTFYVRLGDNDLMQMSGKYLNKALGNNKTISTIQLQNELNDLLTISNNNFMLGVRVDQNNPEIEKLDNFEYYSADTFTDMVRDGYFELIQNFFNKHIIPNKTLYLGSVEKEISEKLLGPINHYINTSSENATEYIENIWDQVKNIIDNYEIDNIILACGQLSRVMAKRLWFYYNENPPFNCIDIGSIIDVVANKPTRYWMKIDNYKHLKTANYNLLKGLYNETIYGMLITGKYKERKPLAKIAIQNFLEQTYPLKKLIIINTDNEYYSETYNNENIHEYLIQQNTNTLGDLRNIALDIIPNESIWVQWDDDDYKSDKLIEYQYNELKKHNFTYILLKNQMMYSFKKHSSIPKYKPFIEGTIMAINKPERYPSNVKGEDTYFMNNLSKKYHGRAINNPVEYYVRNIHYHNTWDDDHFNLENWPVNSINVVGYNIIMDVIEKYKEYYS